MRMQNWENKKLVWNNFRFADTQPYSFDSRRIPNPTVLIRGGYPTLQFWFAVDTQPYSFDSRRIPNPTVLIRGGYPTLQLWFAVGYPTLQFWFAAVTQPYSFDSRRIPNSTVLNLITLDMLKSETIILNYTHSEPNHNKLFFYWHEK